MAIWLKLIVIGLAIPCDAIRGGQFYFEGKLYPILRKICQFAYGALIASLLTDNLYLIALASVLFWIGEKPSWRQFFNSLSQLELEQNYLFLRGAWRGFIWAILPALLAIPQWVYLKEFSLVGFLAMTIAFPLSAYMGYRWQDSIEEHLFTELARPLIFGLLVLGVSLI